MAKEKESVDLQYRYRLFVEKAEKLKRSGYLTHVFENKGTELNITWNNDDSLLEHSTNLPNDDYRDAFSVTFRLFYMDKEPTHFNSIANFLIRDADEETKQKVTYIKEVWNSTLMGKNDLTPVIYNNKLVTPDEIIRLFLFNDLTHLEDRGKVERLRELRIGSSGFIDFKYNNVLISLVNCVIQVSNIIKKILRASHN